MPRWCPGLCLHSASDSHIQICQVPQLATVCQTIRCTSSSLTIASLNILTGGRWRTVGPPILPYFNLTFLVLRRSLIATLLPWEGWHRINALLGDANSVLKDTLLRFSQLCTNARLALTLRFQCDQEEQSLVDDRAHFCDVSIRREKWDTGAGQASPEEVSLPFPVVQGQKSGKWSVGP